jgi:hypothetical protein
MILHLYLEEISNPFIPSSLELNHKRVFYISEIPKAIKHNSVLKIFWIGKKAELHSLWMFRQFLLYHR